MKITTNRKIINFSQSRIAAAGAPSGRTTIVLRFPVEARESVWQTPPRNYTRDGQGPGYTPHEGDKGASGSGAGDQEMNGKPHPLGSSKGRGYSYGEEEGQGTETGRYFYQDENNRPYSRVIHREWFDETGKRYRKCTQHTYVQHTMLPDTNADQNWEKRAPKIKIPYFLPQLIAAPEDEFIFIPEGEPDADACLDIGLVVTTSTEGANKHGWTPELNQWFKDRICIILRDNDPDGKWFARRKRRLLRPVARRAVILMNLNGHKDVRDFIEKEFPHTPEGREAAKQELLKRAEFALALDDLMQLPLEQIDSAKETFCKEWKIGKREVNKLLTEYYKERKLEESEAAEDDDNEPDDDGRKQIPAPQPDAEKAAVMRQLDELLTTDESEPPMRDLSKIPLPVEVTMCEPVNMHLLESIGANSEEEKGYTRLPPPKTHMLTKHDAHSLALLIERYARFYKSVRQGDRVKRVPVAIHDCFVQAYLVYRYSNLPRVGMVLTMPLVLPNGELLAQNGLDRKRKIVFRIEPDILKLLPKGVPDDQAIKDAIAFLVDEWLCDVLMPFAHKCIIIAMALSILERAILPDRPGFFVSAGKRGGGKTTLLHMIALAILGARAAATAWGTSEESRAKAIFSLLLQGVPFVVFDNIPRGTKISSPTIEAISTSMEYSDRVLGVSRIETVSCTTVFCWTGNHIYGKGETASRTLNACVEVNQPDPENRDFKHPDAIRWTLDHRGEILAALYTIMLGNPRLRQGEKERPQAKTRFKEWQHLIGSGIEYAAGLYGESIDFGQMFLSGEADDEETSDMAELLRILDRRFPDQKRFKGGDVKRFLEDKDSTDAATLKGFLGFEGKDDVIPNSKTISSKLTVNTDAPTFVDGRIFTLRKSKEKDATGTYWFWVERPDPDEERM
jgi:hypothetical protein